MKKSRAAIFIFLIVLLIVSGCASKKIKQQPKENRQDLKTVFEEAFEDKSLNEWTLFQVTPPAQSPESLGFNPDKDQARIGEYYLHSDSLEIVQDPLDQKNHVLQITVHPTDTPAEGDKEKDKSRAEIGVKGIGEPGEERWISFRFMIPEDYQDPPEKERTFQVIMQLHRYDKEKDGKYFDGLKLKNDGNTLSPTVSLRYGTENGKSGVGLRYGLKDPEPNYLLKKVFMKKGTWHSIKLHVKWSQGNDGFVEGWINNESLTNERVFGPNMYTNLPRDFRIGLYRGHNIQTTNSIYYDNIKIEK